MRYISMFSGIEAATAAWHPLGWTPIVFSEIDPYASAVLRHHYPTVPNVGDMAAHDWSQYRGACDLVIGGPPCQAFSIAGLRRSLEDDRGNLSLKFAQAIHAIDPVWTLIENVPGWLSTADNAFGCMLAALVGADAPLRSPLERGRWPDAGMVAGPRARAAWRVLDAQYFGLAQRRQRVFLVANFRGGDPAQVLFERQGMRGDPAPRAESGEGITHDLAPCIGASGRGFERAGETRGQDPVIAAPLGTGGPGGGGYRLDPDQSENLILAFGGNNTSGPIDVATARNAHGGPHGRLDFESETFVAHSLRAEGFDASEDGTGRGTPLVPAGFNARQDPDVWVNRSGPIDTDGYTQAAMTKAGVRRLTPEECEKLMGVPVGYTKVPYPVKPAADGPRYRGLGNSMAVPVIAWIGRRIDMVDRLTQ